MTIDELQVLPDKELNALAAKLRGWTIGKSQPWTEDDWRVRYCDVYNESDGAVIPVDRWTPATSRNQSGELLQWAWRIGFTGGASPGYVQYETPVSHHMVRGNDARAESIAFCAAMLAIQGESK